MHGSHEVDQRSTTTTLPLCPAMSASVSFQVATVSGTEAAGSMLAFGDGFGLELFCGAEDVPQPRASTHSRTSEIESDFMAIVPLWSGPPVWRPARGLHTGAL